MKKILSIIFSIAMIICAIPFNASAAQWVYITIPDFTVTANGIESINEQNLYPYILYNDITYFPMTYHDSRLLGLGTEYSYETGLSVYKLAEADNNFIYQRTLTGIPNQKNYTAQLAQGKITVNGKVIDNYTEEYPLLLFRDVTYFPLTWRFMVDEFSWNYSFDSAKGLVINTYESNCPQTAIPSAPLFPDADNNTQAKMIDEVIELVNKYRAENGLSPLTVDPSLAQAANKRAIEINEVFSHTRPDGSSCFTVFSEYDVYFRSAGENIAMGQHTAEHVMDSWMNSEGHRSNILGNYKHIGVGLYIDSRGTRHWVQMFTS